MTHQFNFLIRKVVRCVRARVIMMKANTSSLVGFSYFIKNVWQTSASKCLIGKNRSELINALPLSQFTAKALVNHSAKILTD